MGCANLLLCLHRANHGCKLSSGNGCRASPQATHKASRVMPTETCGPFIPQAMRTKPLLRNKIQISGDKVDNSPTWRQGVACSRAALPLAGCVTLSLSTSLCLRFLTCATARTELHVKGLSAGPHKHSAGCKRSMRPALAGLRQGQQTSSVLTADITSRPSHVSSYFTFLANL